MLRVIICPNCGERLIADEMDPDIEHSCKSGDSSDEDDVLKGTAPIGSSGNYNFDMLGYGSNKLANTDAGIEGAKSYDLTARGARKSTHSQREHIESVDLR